MLKAKVSFTGLCFSVCINSFPHSQLTLSQIHSDFSAWPALHDVYFYLALEITLCF